MKCKKCGKRFWYWQVLLYTFCPECKNYLDLADPEKLQQMEKEYFIHD